MAKEEDRHGILENGGHGGMTVIGGDVEKIGEIGEVEGKVLDAGGDGAKIEGDNDAGGKPRAGRKPLKGRRRGKKKSITKEGGERMAQCMIRWLGTHPGSKFQILDIRILDP